MATLDINRHISKIRAESGRNFLALALTDIQNFVNQQTPTAATSSTTSTSSSTASAGGAVSPASATSTPFNLLVNGVPTAKASGNLNNSMPPAPAGFTSIGFTLDNTQPVPNIGAYGPNSGFVNAQSGTTYVVTTTDFGKLLILTDAAAVAVTIDPSTMPANFFCSIASMGSAGATITPATGTIDGGASLALLQFQGVLVYSDGTNLWTVRGTDVFASTVEPAYSFFAGPVSGSSAIPSFRVVNQADLATSLTSQTATYLVLVTDHTVLGNGTFTITLPTTGLRVDQEFRVKNVGTGTITVSAGGIVNIDGATTLSMPTQYQFASFVWDGSQFWQF